MLPLPTPISTAAKSNNPDNKTAASLAPNLNSEKFVLPCRPYPRALIDDDSTGKKMTLCQLYAKQNTQRANVKKSTQKQREQLMRLLKEDKLGARSIDTIKPSDAKEWALRMKENIHPKYEKTTITCACGNVIETGSTKKDIRVEICSKCHPFFTGKQKLVDTGGRVDRFKKRFGMDK